jgi:hypothetical protein
VFLGEFLFLFFTAYFFQRGIIILPWNPIINRYQAETGQAKGLARERVYMAFTREQTGARGLHRHKDCYYIKKGSPLVVGEFAPM